MISYHLMNEEEKKIISDWQYSGEYEIYNMPSYEYQKENKIALANPKRKKIIILILI